MLFFLDNKESLLAYKKNARRYAESNFNWSLNTLNIDQAFNRPLIAIESKARVISEIHDFERHRFATKISRFFPYLHKILAKLFHIS